FLALSVLNGIAAAIIWLRLPEERRREGSNRDLLTMAASHLTNAQLVSAYAVGFGILCTQVATFTYVTFHLAGPPYRLSTAALGWIFTTYLVGAVVTPAAGQWIDRYGRRTAFIAAIALGIGSVLLTMLRPLVAVLAGLSLFGTSVFVMQATASSHVAATAPRGRGLAVGLYATWYYLGGTVGGAAPSALWNRGGWPACVAFAVVVQATMLAVASSTWSEGSAYPELAAM